MTIKIDDYRELLGEQVTEAEWKRIKTRLLRRIEMVKEETGEEALYGELVADMLLTGNFDVQ
jgi:hypothetical protein